VVQRLSNLSVIEPEVRPIEVEEPNNEDEHERPRVVSLTVRLEWLSE